MVILACIIPNTKANTVVSILGFFMLAFFNSYSSLCREAYGHSALGSIAASLCFVVYVLMIVVVLHQGKTFAIIGTAVFVLSAFVYALPLISRISSILEFSCILKYIALFIIWWRKTSVVLFSKGETAKKSVDNPRNIIIETKEEP